MSAYEYAHAWGAQGSGGNFRSKIETVDLKGVARWFWCAVWCW